MAVTSGSDAFCSRLALSSADHALRGSSQVVEVPAPSGTAWNCQCYGQMEGAEPRSLVDASPRGLYEDSSW